jgi:hypothetical protein
LTAILREAWNTSQQTEDKREKIHALSLAKECYSMKLELLSNATTIDSALSYIRNKQQQKRLVLHSTSNDDNSNSDNNGQLTTTTAGRQTIF